MNNETFSLREGYWKSGEESLLPMPIPNEKPWKGKKRFLEALSKVESQARFEYCRGHSYCRICERENGTATFYFADWIWPVGFSHYIRVHNVRPSLAFQEFILGEKVK